MATKAKGVAEAIEIEPMRVGSISVWLRGRTPIICNRLSAKARRELLLPRGRKTTADKASSLKHDPLSEFVDSMDRRVGAGPTRLLVPSPAVKGAMANAALETKDTNKTRIGRLVWVQGYSCDLYGIPELHMAPVRSADMNRTPDIRTRAMLKAWCVPVTIQFVKPQITDKAVLQLLSNGGIIMGIGDWRQEKGKGSHGQFDVVTEAECKDIVKAGGLRQQDAAIEHPAFADSQTEELFSWFQEEVQSRGKGELLNGRYAALANGK